MDDTICDSSERFEAHTTQKRSRRGNLRHLINVFPQGPTNEEPRGPRTGWLKGWDRGQQDLSVLSIRIYRYLYTLTILYIYII